MKCEWTGGWTLCPHYIIILWIFLQWKHKNCKSFYADWTNKFKWCFIQVLKSSIIPLTITPHNKDIQSLPDFFFACAAIATPRSSSSTTITKSASLNCRDVRAGVPVNTQTYLSLSTANASYQFISTFNLISITILSSFHIIKMVYRITQKIYILFL